MGMGHVPPEPFRAEGAGAHVQGRERGGAADRRSVALTRAARPSVDRRNQARGRWGEDVAARWYTDRGARLVARNWRCDTGEIDLIVLVRGRGGAPVIVFAEVKARRSERYGAAAAAVDARKQARLRRLGARWLAEHRAMVDAIGVDVAVRFDVVAITGTHVEVIEHAF